MLNVTIAIVSLCLLAALVATVVGLISPRSLARLVPWVGRPEPSRKRAAVAGGVALGVLIILVVVLVSIPNYDVTVAEGERVVAGQSRGLDIVVSNSAAVGGTYAAVASVDGTRVGELNARVGGRDVKELTVPLPPGLAPGRHTVTVGDRELQIVALKPAHFEVTSLESDTDLAKTGERVSVTVVVENTGEVPGEFDGELTANGRRYDAQPTPVNGGGETYIVYKFRSRTQRKYRLKVGQATLDVVIVKPLHYQNGHYLCRKAGGGRGMLDVKNGNEVDGVVVLTRTSARKVPVVSCYVRAHRAVKIEGIPDGKYWVYYSLGSGWNTYMDGFMVCQRSGYFSKPCPFRTSSSTSSWVSGSYAYTQTNVRYTRWKITLDSVADGNARIVNVPQEKVPTVH